jgi:hypothetical protein
MHVCGIFTVQVFLQFIIIIIFIGSRDNVVRIATGKGWTTEGWEFQSR